MVDCLAVVHVIWTWSLVVCSCFSSVVCYYVEQSVLHFASSNLYLFYSAQPLDVSYCETQAACTVPHHFSLPSVSPGTRCGSMTRRCSSSPTSGWRGSSSAALSTRRLRWRWRSRPTSWACSAPATTATARGTTESALRVRQEPNMGDGSAADVWFSGVLWRGANEACRRNIW